MFKNVGAVILFCLACLLERKLTDASAGSWSYDGDVSPEHWHEHYPLCAGVHQSPIDINNEDVKIAVELGNVDLNSYRDDKLDHTGTMSLENNGHSVQVDIASPRPTIEKGGLGGVYEAAQFHFHWGHDDRRGSEHKIDGMAYPMEMHIVHYNKKFANLSEASNETDGLAVLGFLFKVGEHNSQFNEIIDHFDNVTHRDEHVTIHSFPLLNLLPASTNDFYRYRGSLTTPPCYESVIWTIFNDRIEISEDQLNQFRHKVKSNYVGDEEHHLWDDYRPIQGVGDRTVYANGEFHNEAASLFLSGASCFLLILSVYAIS